MKRALYKHMHYKKELCTNARCLTYVFLYMCPYICILRAYVIVAQTFTYVFCKHMEVSCTNARCIYIAALPTP